MRISHDGLPLRAGPHSEPAQLPSFDSILDADAEPGSTRRLPRGDYTSPPRTISLDRYIDPKFVALEVEHIWKKQWQIACREEDIPNVGDRTNYDIVDNSYVLVRTAHNEIKAFYNSCRHRARKLCTQKENAPALRCGFHGWTYDLDGRLQWMPLASEFHNVDPLSHSLRPVAVAVWGGNVFINPDLNCDPLEDSLGILVEHFMHHPMQERYTAIRILSKIRCNWKAAQEAFMEAYHLMETHADGMPASAASATEIDIWGARKGLVSRLRVPGMIADPYIAEHVSPRDTLAFWCAANGFPVPLDDGREFTSAEARHYAAQLLRGRIEGATRKDYSSKSTSHFVDYTLYFMFPNFHPWWGETLPWWYNFIPLGTNPDQCQMEFRILMPIPASGKRPPVPEPIEIDFDEKASNHPELGALGIIIDQDLANMNALQQGMKAAGSESAYLTLADNHEAAIRHFHEIYERTLGIQNATVE